MTRALGKDLVGLEGLSPEQIRLILDTAEPFKEVSERPIKKVPALRGKTVINLFYEPSTRTRTSFEIAAKRLSADTVNVSASSSSVSKGETLADTARNLEAMRPDAIVVRHPSSGACHLLARHVSCPILNAGDGCHEHGSESQVAVVDPVAELLRCWSSVHGIPPGLVAPATTVSSRCSVRVAAGWPLTPR